MLVRLVFQGDLPNDTFATHKISSAIDACGGSAANLVNIMMLPQPRNPMCYQYWDSDFSNRMMMSYCIMYEESIHVCSHLHQFQIPRTHNPSFKKILSKVRIPWKFRTSHDVLSWIKLKWNMWASFQLTLLTCCLQKLSTRQALEPAICLPEVALERANSKEVYKALFGSYFSILSILRTKLLLWNFMNVWRSGIQHLEGSWMVNVFGEFCF
jgi:hypothetical protein